MASFKQSAAWQALLRHRDALAGQRISGFWQADPRRGERLTFHCAGIAVDFSKQRIVPETLPLLVQLARERGVAEGIERLFAGERINTSENRPVLHTALRGDEHVVIEGHELRGDIQRVRERMRTFAQAVREGLWKGATHKTIRHVLALGIGGSALGPKLALEALRAEADGPEVRFIANIDPAEFDDAVAGFDPEATLVVVASKTFTTQETMVNAAAAREWLRAAVGEHAVARHFVAATANEDEAARWGLPQCNVFPFGEWVGGRFSLWSSVGLPLAIGIGMPRFEQLLAGAHAVDIAFRSSPLESNVPALLGLIGVWNRNALDVPTHAVLGYASRLENLPAYLQQLEMESNGKRVDRDGEVLDFSTCPVVWGGPETNGQHAFHQWLHQGTDVASCDFIVVAHSMGTHHEHHRILLANALAQSEALMDGVATPESWRACPGDRMSTTFVLPALDAFHLGALLAIYEHKVFVQGRIWGINSFDQWGVELGKKIAGQILPALQGKPARLNPATGHLLGILRKMARE
jgi:glucose-6-phosphate isomerase